MSVTASRETATMNGHNQARDNLPDRNSAVLALIHPTEIEVLRQFAHNGASWRGPLSQEAYDRREKHLANQDLTRDGGITYWILVDTSVPSSERSALCGCETFEKRALVKRGSRTEDRICHGIGSVFCPPEFRGRGYAGRMMKELGKTLSSWKPRLHHGDVKGTSTASPAFSILFSDIGKQFYAAHGWLPFPSSHLSVPSDCESSSVSPEKTSFKAQPLLASEVKDLCKVDEHSIRQSIQNALPSEQEKTYVALLPDAATISWHHAREDFVTTELFGKTPQIKGAIVNRDQLGHRVWCFWTRMYESPLGLPADQSGGNKLHILRLVVEDQGMFNWEDAQASPEQRQAMRRYSPAIASLIIKALEQAREWQCRSVDIWNPTDAVREAARLVAADTVRFVNREQDSIASLRWHADGEGLGSQRDVVWLGNEKYVWC